MASYTVKCVTSDNGESTDAQKVVFESLKEAELDPVWVTESHCLTLKERDKESMFIVDPFEGKAFEHLKQTKNRLYGPQCLLTCLKNAEAAPRASHPIFTLGMKNLVISCTGVEKNEREKIHDLVELMGGEVSRNFTQSVTHLVAGEVGSKKYLVAGSLGVSIMLPQWVYKVWSKSKEEYCHGMDSEFQEYRCPVFKDLVITVSGITNDERKEVKQVVEAQGGRYTGEMKINDCTHLIVNEPKGQKYEFAVKWKIHIITLSWLYDSVENGYCMDEHKYKTGAVSKASTPVRKKTQAGSLPNITDISNINNISYMSNIDETGMSTANLTRLSTTSKAGVVDTSSKDPLEDLDLTVRPTDTFLDGCKLFLSGFKGSKIEKLRKIINAGGGTRFNQLNDNVSHIIIGERVEEHVKQITEMKNSRPYIVSPSWLVECFKQGTHVDEEQFKCLDLPPLEQSESVKLSSSRPSLTTKMDTTAVSAPAQPLPPGQDDDMENIMSQYLIQQNDVTDESALLRAVEQEEAKLEQDPPQQGDQDDQDDTQLEGVIEDQLGLFDKKTFVILGFESDQMEALKKMIEENKGIIVSTSTRTVPHFALVPILTFPVEMTVGSIVTNAWLQMCIENEIFLPPSSNPLFTPLELKPDCEPLVGCVLSVSGYIGVERDCLMHLADLLGAKTEEYFSRKASTHLLVREAEGSKYKAAVKWSIPAVTSSWIFACARSGQREPEEDYLVDKALRKLEPKKPASSETENKLIFTNNSDQSGTEDKTVQKKSTDSKENKKSSVSGQVDLTVETNDIDQSERKSGKEKLSNDLTRENKSGEMSHRIDDKQQESSSDAEQNKGIMLDTVSTKTSINEAERSKVVGKPPITPRPVNSRVMALKTPGGGSDAVQSRHSPRMKAGIDTPGKFLAPGKEFHPSFDLQEFEQALQSPANQQTPRNRRMSRQRKASLPIEEVFSHHMSQAIKNTAVGTNHTNISDRKEENEVFLEQPRGPLRGVIIAVSRKLSNNQSDYNNMAAKLGADYRWTYDESCTHFIFQGRNNDTSKEFRMAREQGKFIVSPYWLQMCQEQNARVEESLFPPNYNPNLSLQTVVSKKSTPIRATRRSTRASVRSSKVPSPPLPAPSPPTVRSPPTAPNASAPPADLEGEDVVNVELGLDTTQSDEEMAEACEELDEKDKENGGSAEMNAALSKQLENIMAATKAQKQSRRSIRRANSSADVLNSSAETVSDGNRSRPPSSKSLVKPADEDDSSTLEHKPSSSAKPTTSHPEPSQSLQEQVGWDDPVSRLEQEKLARELQRATSPTQMSESLSPLHRQKEHRYSSEEEQAEKTDDDIVFKVPAELKTSPKEARIPTPEPPPLEQPQPVEIITEENEDLDSTQLPAKEEQPRVFMLSGMPPQERDHYGALIEELGGRILDAQVYEPACTHLVVGTPTRNEKYLACVATGKWVLHKSYFEACKGEGKFVDEADHEWGGPGMNSLLQTMKEQVVKLGKAAHRWRLHISQARMRGLCAGAFEGWNVIICTEKNKEGGFRRLLEAGGAKVMATRPPFGNLREVSHAFMDLAKVKYQVDLSDLVSADVQCLRPEYIAAYLMEDPPPAHNSYYINELQEHIRNDKTGDEVSRKRKGSRISTPSKRGRH